MVNETAHTGDISKNPFNFQHFNCSEASIVVNGSHEPAESYKLDISAGNYVNLYTDFLLNTGISNEDRDCGLHEGDFLGGSFFLIFDRSKDKCNRFHRHLSDAGSLDVSIRTRTSLAQTVTVLVYATYSSEIVVDDANNVTLLKSF